MISWILMAVSITFAFFLWFPFVHGGMDRSPRQDWAKAEAEKEMVPLIKEEVAPLVKEQPSA